MVKNQATRKFGNGLDTKANEGCNYRPGYQHV